ncbi:hypothetical protein JVT61DRAFT_4855 [Boletus reticuloceps]|uniref:Peptidase metallopeptidase domain-containing protein n=1 Tax=Boletus reticuloceps TaxID=495285 RepID=A0A8I2YLQ0_9AGAM|nr:hypothetical protein JVT61DRAFT_4855 [Boletus reticuloceps]
MATCQNAYCGGPTTIGSGLPAAGRGPTEAAWPFGSLIQIDGNGPWTLEIKVGFLDAKAGYMLVMKDAVINSIKKERAEKLEDKRETWEHWANISFKEVEFGEADIRVGFDKRDGSWSRIGRNANKYKGEVTLNLGRIGARPEPNDNDFGTILHEFGHALGLLHEHQSPLRGSDVSRKIQRQAGAYSRRAGSKQLVEDQMTSEVSQGSISILSAFDPCSVMMYQIDGVTERPNNKLSRLDKAFITLYYPPDLTDYKNETTKKMLSRFKTAIRDAGLESAGGKILEAFQNPGSVLKLPSGASPTMADRLQAVRNRFMDYDRAMYLRRSTVNISNSVDASAMKQYSLYCGDPPFGLTDPMLARQYGLTDPLRDVAKNKLFQSLVKNIVKNAVKQHGIPMGQSIAGVSPTEVATMMAAISSHERIAQYVEAYKDDFQGSKPSKGSDAQDERIEKDAKGEQS